MKKIIFSILFIYFVHCSDNTKSTINFIKEFLKHKNEKFVVFYTCWKLSDIIGISKTFNSIRSTSVMIRNYGSVIKNYNQHQEIMHILDLSCSGFKQILHQETETFSFNFYHRWLILGNLHKTEYFANNLHILKNLPIRMDSDISFAMRLSTKFNITVFEVHNPGFNMGGTLTFTTLGNYYNNSFILSNNCTTYKRRLNMTGVTVRAATVNTYKQPLPIEIYYEDRRWKNYDSINKMNYALFKHIQEIHNFTVHLIVTDKWFGNTRNGVDGGLAQVLYENTADIAATAGLMKSERIDDTEFIMPTYPFRTCFIFRNPGVSQGVANGFIRPFAYSVWYFIIGFTALISIFLKIIYSIEHFLFSSQEYNWSVSILNTLSAFFQQGSFVPPVSTSGRFIFMTLLMLSLLLYNYYTSSIVSSLLSDPPPPINTIKELTQSDLKVGAEDVVYTRTLFEVTTDPDVQYLYKHKILTRDDKPLYLSPTEGIKQVEKGYFAYHTEPATGYPIIEKMFEPSYICELAEINLFKPAMLSVMAQKRSQYKKLLAVSYRKIIQSGIHFRQLSIWQTKKPTCLSNINLKPVEMLQVFPAFVILFIGIAIAFFFLSIEVYYVRIVNYKNMSKKSENDG